MHAVCSQQSLSYPDHEGRDEQAGDAALPPVKALAGGPGRTSHIGKDCNAFYCILSSFLFCFFSYDYMSYLSILKIPKDEMQCSRAGHESVVNLLTITR